MEYSKLKDVADSVNNVASESYYTANRSDLNAANKARAVQPVATCRQSPYLRKPAIAIVTSFSL